MKVLQAKTPKKEGSGAGFRTVRRKSPSGPAAFNPIALLSRSTDKKEFQTKLKIGRPGDMYEQEADRISAQVMTMPEPVAQLQAVEEEENESIQARPIADQITPLIQRQPEEEEPVQTKPLIQRQAEEEEEPIQSKSLIQRQTEEEEEPVQEKSLLRRQAEEEEESVHAKSLVQHQSEEEEEPIQTKLLLQRQAEEDEESIRAKTGSGSIVGSGLQNQLTSTKGSGDPLSETTRSFMESRFGRDFGNVRIHTDNNATTMSKELGAQAFTHGNDIYFNEGKYNPSTRSGKQLLGHELTHVIQQKRLVPAIYTNQDIYAPMKVSKNSTLGIARQGLETVAEEKRKKLIIPNVGFILKDKDVDTWFDKLKSGKWGTTKTLGLPVKLKGIEETYRVPMTSVASMLVDYGLSSNRTLTVNLKLKKHGLSDANYRFSWVGTKRKGTVYIELLGSGPKAETKPIVGASKGKAKRSGTITIGKLTFHYKGWKAGHLSDLERALALTPMSALERIDGMTFTYKKGMGPKKEAGSYNTGKHTATIYTKAWEESSTRMGESTYPVQVISHEIGHAVDYAPIRTSSTPLKTRSLSGVKISRGTMKPFEPLAGLTKRGTLLASEADFRKAAEKDGVVPKTKKGTTLKRGITEGGRESYNQLFAESFMLYVNDPDLFKLIRPNMYEYFAKHFPRK